VPIQFGIGHNAKAEEHNTKEKGTEMAHRVEIYEKDSKGNVIDVIDVNYYCTDNCAKNDPEYDGWNGCAEIPEEYGSVICATCGCGL